MDFARADGFYASPFPCESRRGPDGRVDLTGFPNPQGVPFVTNLIEIVERDADGFALTAGIFFQVEGALDAASLPDLQGSVAPGAAVYLADVDPASPERGRRVPVEVQFAPDGGPHGAENLLSLLPLQGVPLREDTLYAAVATTGVRDAAGRPLAPAPAVEALQAGEQPAGLGDAAFAAYRAALDSLDSDLAALAVFRTGRPRAALLAARARAIASPPRPDAPFAPAERFDDFCVFTTTLPMPVFQTGTPPFRGGGGGWSFGEDGAPLPQGQETANVVVTLPRRPMPAEGFPVVVFVRTGGGGDRPLVDRGVRAVDGGPAIAPGTGPALEFARAGYAGISVDGPHGGRRNITGGDEQFLMFDITRPVAMRDNFRQSALEIALLAHALDDLRVDPEGCPEVGTDEARFDPASVVLMGHSMGATIAPVAAAIEPRYRALILSGAGGSWIENIVHKRRPLPTRPLAETILRYGRRELHTHDPALSLLQWAGEAADPPIYAPLVVGADPPRHVLMLQGIADTYILPPIANALSLSLGLDLAGPALDADHPVAGAYTPLAEVLDLVGRRAIDLPAAGNRDTPTGPVTAVVTQHLEDGVEDGHEVVFQTEPPKRQYYHFLQSLLGGTPEVPPSAEDR